MTHPEQRRYQGTNAVLYVEGYDPIPVTVTNWPSIFGDQPERELPELPKPELPPVPEGFFDSLLEPGKRLGTRLPLDQQPPVPPPSIGPRVRWGGVK